MKLPVNTRAYREGELVDTDFAVMSISDHLALADTSVWIDLCGPSVELLHELASELGLHELAVEDALSDHQRPKLDTYDSHLFLSSHAVVVDQAERVLYETEIDAFIGERWIITVRKNDRFHMDQVEARRDRSGTLISQGVSVVLYALLDVIIDGYFTAIEAFDDYYDRVSEGIFSERPLDPAQQREWFQMRQALVRFHRLSLPMREAISGLLRHEHLGAGNAMSPYFQDVYDHAIRVTESTDALRDLISTLVETNLSLRDYRQNQVTKKITSWAAIIAVPTLITGYYGMNVPYPGAGKAWGVWVSVGLIVALSAGLYAAFRRRDWL